MSYQDLAHYIPEMPINIAPEASAYKLGGVISFVYHDGCEKTILPLHHALY